MRCACFRRKLALFTNFSRLFRHYALEKSFKTCIIAFCARCARLGPGTDFDFQKGIYNYETVHQDRCCLRPGCQPGRLRQLRFFYRRFFCCLFRGCFQRCCFFCGCQRGRFFRGCFQRSRSLQRRSTGKHHCINRAGEGRTFPAFFVAPPAGTCYTGTKNNQGCTKARKRP